jgi:hypothetical protein
MSRQPEEPDLYFPDTVEILRRIYQGHWIGVEDPDGDALPMLMRIDRSANSEHLVCTALVIAAEMSLNADLGAPRVAITPTALRELKLKTRLEFLEQHPRINFPRAVDVPPHPGRAGRDDAFYRKWVAGYRKIARDRKRRPRPRDYEELPRSTFYRYRQEAIRRGFLKEDE